MIALLLGLALLLLAAAEILIFQSLRPRPKRAVWLPGVLFSLGLLALAILFGLLIELSRSPGSHPQLLAAGLAAAAAAGLFLAGVYFRKGADTAARQQVERLDRAHACARAVFECLPVAVALKDPQDAYLAANPAYCALLGKKEAELLGRTDLEFFPPGQADQFRQVEERARQTGLQQVQFERFPGVDGVRWLQVTRAPLAAECGAGAAVLVAAADYTAAQQKVAGFQRAVEALQFQARLEQRVAAAAAHFIQLPAGEVEAAIQRAVQSIGEACGIDRCYLYLYPRGSAEPGRLYEWGAQGLPSRPTSPQQVGAWMEKFNRLETVHINGQRELPAGEDELARALRAQGVKSFAAVPLLSRRSAIGYLGFEALRAESHLPPEVLSLFKTIAEMFVNTLERQWADEAQERARLQESRRAAGIEQRNQEILLMAEMGDLLQACRTVEEAYPIIARYTCRLFPNLSGALYLVRNPRDPAENIAAWGPAPPGPAEHELALNECWGVRRGHLHVVAGQAAGPVCSHLRKPVPQSYLCEPLIAQGETLGLLHLRDGQAPPGSSGLTEPQQRLAVMVAEHIALTLSNLKLRDELRSQAIRDPLTGLFNRRYMEETLDRELRRAIRRGTTVGVIMLDMDKLKKTNDTLGHDAGDALLLALGGLMLKTFRGEDVACRYGGDEFTIILPEASLADTWQRAEGLREAFKKLEIEYEGKRLQQVSLSIGVAAYPEHGATAERLIQESDAAAYAAKNEGGDRVMMGHVGEE